jgi:hypothetical protein
MTSDAPRISIRSIEIFERPVAMRLPFRFGAVTVRETPQAFIRAEIAVMGADGAEGAAAELKVPKWFDKNAKLSNEDNVRQLDRALALAQDAYASDRTPAPVFGHHLRHARDLREVAAGENLPSLVASFGLALIDRALIDALCRGKRVSFTTALRANLFGFAPAGIAPDLKGMEVAPFLESLQPTANIAARHTVGLIDPLDDEDRPADAPDDGLPVTLREVIAAYGHDHFKLKLSGDIDADIERLARIAAILDREVKTYVVTLDGNEQFPDADSVAALVDAIFAAPSLGKLRAAIRFIEQPIARSAALEVPLGRAAERLDIIIDESDAEDGTLLDALKLGYGGISSKACKGVWRSLINKARLMRRPGGGILSGEDLTTQAGLGVQQDLALVSALGLTDVERNGHHYVDGFASTSPAEAARFLAAHADLYQMRDGRVRLKIGNGRLALGSVNEASGLGSAVLPDFGDMRQVTG